MKRKQNVMLKVETNKQLKCPLCHDELQKVDGISLTFNGLCEGCARTTYIMWRDLGLQGK